MSKKIKALELGTLQTAFQGVRDYVIVAPAKVDAATDFEFRKTLRSKNVRVQMVKNSYAKKIFTEMGIQVDVWSGPTLLCWGGGSVKGLSTAVDESVKASRKDPKAPEKYTIKTAVADGQPVAMELALKMPTREEAIGEIISALMAPGAEIISALNAPGGDLAGILKAIEEKGPSGGTEPAEAPAGDTTPAA